MNTNVRKPYTYRQTKGSHLFQVGMLLSDDDILPGLKYSSEEAALIAEALNEAYKMAYVDIISDLNNEIEDNPKCKSRWYSNILKRTL